MVLESKPARIDGRVNLLRESAGVALLTIERTEKRNALSLHIKAELADAVSRCAADPEVRAIVITGAGGVFVAGTDVAEMVEMNPLDHVHAKTDSVFTALRSCAKPLIAAVEAYALGGGCELALCCDIVIAGRNARFGQPEIRLGIMPGAGGTQRWVRAMGSYRAMPYLLSGESLTAEDAHAAGLISEVTVPGEALPRALALATAIAALPPLAIKAIKASVKLGENAGLDAALCFERHNFQLLFGSYDQREGMQAFLEKRVARFEGR